MLLRELACRCVSVLAMALSMTAHAADGWGGSIGAVSDYAHRGISQTRGASALQGGAYLELPNGWSVGVWASNMDLGWTDAAYEIDANLTRSWLLAERWSAQMSYTHYFYPGEHGDYDYDEWTASLTYRDRVTATVGMSPNASLFSYGTVRKKRAVSYELTLLQPIGERWSITGGAGHYDIDGGLGSGYWFWSTGLAFSWQAMQLDLVRIDTDDAALRLFGYERAGSRWSAALTWKF
jgi:uncharacterized protein (TIGR02001 family)